MATTPAIADATAAGIRTAASASRLAVRPSMASRTLGRIPDRRQPFVWRKFPPGPTFGLLGGVHGHGGRMSLRVKLSSPVADAVPDDAGRRLRIAHVAEAFGGGLLEVVKTMAEGAAAQGNDVLIV